MPARTITLADRVNMAKGAIETARAKRDQIDVEITGYLDDLAKAEAEVLGGEGGGVGVIPLSGLIEEGKNPYYEPPKAAPTRATHDPDTDEHTKGKKEK